VSAERPLVFSNADTALLGIVHEPEHPKSVGVVIVVGGPQYRVGSHRQFVLLARELARGGYSTLRFDYRGMGDSEGTPVDFEHVQSDVRAAIDTLMSEVPAVRGVVLWGLCDGASASLMYAPSDRRVAGVVLLNPWARSPEGLAQTYLDHYYGGRLRDPAFWKRLLTGRVNVVAAGLEFLRNRHRAACAPDASATRSDTAASLPTTAAASLLSRLDRAVSDFRGRLLLITSGRDLTAQEFEAYATRSRAWQRTLASERASRQVLAEANHTFSTRAWRDQVADWTRNWLETLS
jgi:exosortase A-associated hydrolase 1